MEPGGGGTEACAVEMGLMSILGRGMVSVPTWGGKVLSSGLEKGQCGWAFMNEGGKLCRKMNLVKKAGHIL